MALGLKARVILAFGVLSLAVALLVSLTAYYFARTYLVTQRESSGITRAALDARAVFAALSDGADPGDAVAAVPVVGGVQALARVDDTWYTRGVTVSPDDLPTSLLDVAGSSGAAQQRFAVGGTPLFGVAVAQGPDVYLELSPLAELDSALKYGSWYVAGIALAAFGLGGLLGRWAATRVLRPVQSLSDGAVRIAEGDLSARLDPTSDPDLEQLTTAFNEMADAVEQRIARERRFVANVSHELRSPVTAVLGTAELLHNHRAALPPRDAELVEGLVTRSRRLSRTLVDLLEIGGGSGGHPMQIEAVDVAGIAEALLHERSLPVDLLQGDTSVVRTDARRVERVLSNLIDNASTHGEGLSAVVVERLPDQVRVHVHDSGPGISTEDAEQIFEPFVRRAAAPHAHDGAGLGLAIARDAARALGGDVLIGASPHGGAVVTLLLPSEERA